MSMDKGGLVGKSQLVDSQAGYYWAIGIGGEEEGLHSTSLIDVGLDTFEKGR